MGKIIYGIYGASGFGREVMPLLRDMVSSDSVDYELLFIDDSIGNKSEINGYKIISFEHFLTMPAQKRYVNIAIANSNIREELTHRCLKNSIELIDIRATNAIVLDSVSMDSGSILCPFVTLTSNIKIGRSFHANIYSYVAHDCTIGDYVTFAPAVRCNGNVTVGDHAYIGTGAIIKQGRADRPLVIGRGAVIGAGAVVTKSVPDGMTVFGNPAIELTKENLKRRR